MYFVRGAGNSSRGRTYFLLPGDCVMGETLFRDSGTTTSATMLLYLARKLVGLLP